MEIIQILEAVAVWGLVIAVIFLASRAIAAYMRWHINGQ